MSEQKTKNSILYKLDENLNVVPCEREAWSKYATYDDVIEDYKERMVGCLRMQNEGVQYHISTVFLRLEHPGGMFFETMVFTRDPQWSSHQERYATYEEAQKGFLTTIKRIYIGKAPAADNDEG